jgi:hypothetical protein
MTPTAMTKSYDSSKRLTCQAIKCKMFHCCFKHLSQNSLYCRAKSCCMCSPLLVLVLIRSINPPKMKAQSYLPFTCLSYTSLFPHHPFLSFLPFLPLLPLPSLSFSKSIPSLPFDPIPSLAGVRGVKPRGNFLKLQTHVGKFSRILVTRTNSYRNIFFFLPTFYFLDL